MSNRKGHKGWSAAKKCSFCQTYEQLELTVPEHPCNRNHDGSSGSMEATLARTMVEEVSLLSKGKVAIGTMVTDDDSTLRRHCSSTENGGKLLAGVPEPIFLADPGHRVKVMVKPIFTMVTTTKNPDDIKNLDALRLKKYTSCYIMRHRTDDFESFLKNARAPVEHLFNSHEFCDASWCWAKEIEVRMQKIMEDSVQKR